LTLLATLAAVPAQAQRMPQGSWYLATKAPPGGSASGIAIDPSGNIFVSDSADTVIRKYDASFNLLKTFGSTGDGSGQFRGVRVLAIGSNQSLYTIEETNSRVQIFDFDGNPKGQFGTEGTADGCFNKPSGIAVGKDTGVYVSDKGNSRVQIFDETGGFQSKFGSSGFFDGQFSSPGSISTFPNGNLAVADYSNKRIQTFDSVGNFLRKCKVSDAFKAGDPTMRKFIFPSMGDRLWDVVLGYSLVYAPEFIFAGNSGALYATSLAASRSNNFQGYATVVLNENLSGLKGWWDETNYYNGSLRTFDRGGPLPRHPPATYWLPMETIISVSGNAPIASRCQNRETLFPSQPSFPKPGSHGLPS